VLASGATATTLGCHSGAPFALLSLDGGGRLAWFLCLVISYRALGVLLSSADHDIQTRTISAAARPAIRSYKYQSGFFFTTWQIDPIAI